ncbi:hypothetical protein Clacol_002219 [Clathrus columnatus]|uniref:NAD(P)-binding protein n=1 Tax=Clathrus columnatus TaxID=1419009 RepID=A0AAV5A041_9AGAM|nr:hypothetical protein Clacol_002219 [Clathrus columnatus]
MASTKGAAIITGAAQGLGKAIALRLARDGFNVVLYDLPCKSSELKRVSDGIRAAGRQAIVVLGDVTDEVSIKGLVDKTVIELGPLRVMVANAGIIKPGTKFMDVNLLGVFLCYREAARQMSKQGGWGRIIGASSIAGLTGVGSSPAYSASKAGVAGLTRVLGTSKTSLPIHDYDTLLATELKGTDITVNAYAPGAINTPMAQASVQIDEKLSEEDKLEKLSERLDKIGLRVGDPDDVAGLVSYLASEESRFMTGQILQINGGSS